MPCKRPQTHPKPSNIPDGQEKKLIFQKGIGRHAINPDGTKWYMRVYPTGQNNFFFIATRESNFFQNLHDPFGKKQIQNPFIIKRINI